MPGSNIFTNAFGYLNEQQLARLKKFLTVSTTEPLILGLHHHLGNPVVALKGKVRVLDRGLTLCNADALLRALPDARSYVAFNGHRHIHYTGLIDGRVTVISGESTTLGNSVETNEAKENTDPSIARYKLSWLPSGDFEGFERLPELSLKK
jgi:hypothetical protein